MTIKLIFTKIGNFIENRHIFMLLNCNCAKLDNFDHFETFTRSGGVFVDTVYACVGHICTVCLHCIHAHTVLNIVC